MIVRNPQLRGFGDGTVWMWDGSQYVNNGASSTGDDQYLGGPQDPSSNFNLGVKYAYQNGNWMPVGPASGPNDEYLDQGLDVPAPQSGAGGAGGVVDFFMKLLDVGTKALTPPPTAPAYKAPAPSGWMLPVGIGVGALVLLGTGIVAFKKPRRALAGYRGRR